MPRYGLRADSRVTHYIAAAGLAVAAQVATLPFAAGRAPLIIYAPFMVLSAIFGGLGPGLLATLLCFVEAEYFVVEHLSSFALRDLRDWDRLLALLLTGVLASVFSMILKRSSKQLAAAHRKTSAILDSIHDGFVAFDHQWRYTYVNRSASEMLGKSPEEMLGKNLWELWPLVADLPSGAIYRRAMEENVFLQVEDFYGEPLNAWFEVHCYPSPEGLSLFFTDTTQRRHDQERLRLLESAVLQTSEGVLIVEMGSGERCHPDPIFVNSSFEQMTGYSLEDLQAGSLALLYGPRLNPLLIQRPQPGCEVKCPSDLEQTIQRKDGSEIWAEFNFRPLADPAGNYKHCVWTCRDITARKRAAEESRLLTSIVECSDDAIISKDLDGIILTWNHGAEQIYGYSAAEMVGQSVTRLAPPGHESEVVEILEYLRLGQKIDHMETVRRRKDGQQIFVALTISPLRDDDGKIVGASVISRDITERKRSEEALARSELRYRSLVNAVSQIIWTTNPEGEVEEDMPFWREFTGKSFEEIKGWGWLETLHPDDRALTADIWSRAVQDRSTYTTQYRIRRRDGEYRWMSVHGVVMLDEQGSVQEWVGICADIHDRVVAEEEVRNLNLSLEKRVAERTAELQAANRELESFAYSVSHDLRAPLRAVDGFSRILVEEHAPQLSEEARRFLGLVRKNAVQMGDLIDGLLAFSRLGRQVMNNQPIAPAELARQVLTDLAAEQQGRQVEVTVDEMPNCQGDPLLLKQVYFNLLSNALKYTRRCALARIQVGWFSAPAGASKGSNDSVVYYVRDNGAGFDMRYADKLFGVFQRLHRAEDYEGTGVGLATVSRIITRHGGRIWAEAAPDQGATFYFTLQAQAEDGGRAHPREAMPAAAENAHHKGN